MGGFYRKLLSPCIANANEWVAIERDVITTHWHRFSPVVVKAFKPKDWMPTNLHDDVKIEGAVVKLIT